jgi:hypothetical protein
LAWTGATTATPDAGALWVVVLVVGGFGAGPGPELGTQPAASRANIAASAAPSVRADSIRLLVFIAVMIAPSVR